MCVRLDDLNHSRACPTSTPSSGCRVPNTRHRVTTAPTENQDLLFSISALATSASIHMKGRRGKQGPNQVTDLKAVLLRETSSKDPPPDQPAAAEPKPPSPSNLEDTMEAGARLGACTPTGSSSQHMHKPCSLSLAPSQGPTKSTGRC